MLSGLDTDMMMPFPPLPEEPQVSDVPSREELPKKHKKPKVARVKKAKKNDKECHSFNPDLEPNAFLPENFGGSGVSDIP